MLGEFRDEVVQPVVQLSRPQPTCELLRGGAGLGRECLWIVRQRTPLAKQLAEEGQILTGRPLPSPDLPGNDRTDVGGDKDLEALLAGDLGAELAEQVLGNGVEQLGRCRAILGHRISSSMSHSGSQIRRPSEASSWLRRAPVRWSWACRAQMIAHLTLPRTSQKRSRSALTGRPPAA